MMADSDGDAHADSALVPPDASPGLRGAGAPARRGGVLYQPVLYKNTRRQLTTWLIDGKVVGRWRVAAVRRIHSGGREGGRDHRVVQ